MVTSHLGRPKEGVWSEADSLAPVAQRLSELLGREVPLVRDWVDGVEVQPGQLVLLENCRMNVGEGKDDEALSKKYAALCDVFVMDAFGTAHRAQASTHGVIRFAPVAAGGPLLMAELDALAQALDAPAKPLLAIVAGSKVSTKLELLANLVGKVDQLIVGGGIANTFIAAAGYNVGKSLYEPDLLDTAKKIVADARARGADIPLPVDVVTAKQFLPDAVAEVKAVDAVAEDDLILDIGPQTAAQYAQLIDKAGTVVWNGPVGVFEFEAFSKGTEALARAIASSRRSPSPVAATPWRRSTSSISPSRSATSPPAAARSWSSWKARPCRRWPHSTRAAHECRARQGCPVLRPGRHADRLAGGHHRLHRLCAAEDGPSGAAAGNAAGLDRSFAAYHLHATVRRTSAGGAGGGLLPRALRRRRLARTHGVPAGGRHPAHAAWPRPPLGGGHRQNEPHARRILAHLPFGGLFEEIVGSTLDGSRSRKPELVGRHCAACNCSQHSAG